MKFNDQKTRNLYIKDNNNLYIVRKLILNILKSNLNL